MDAIDCDSSAASVQRNCPLCGVQLSWCEVLRLILRTLSGSPRLRRRWAWCSPL
ncbi:hypothetical protein OH76DRAFT_1401361 [Lentinus brumalis]|uniref:Uncharacterized protein n=1 Tax=Lentinus brumalis TaxID=2498619 RepID=A0A371DG24_9APHY|nr:hypothetical protein OH76DRAFT_1401361 [Polyporus brumalis]